MKDRKFSHNSVTINKKGANPVLANPLVLKCRVAESNHGHEDFQSSALPTELTRRRD